MDPVPERLHRQAGQSCVEVGCDLAGDTCTEARNHLLQTHSTSAAASTSETKKRERRLVALTTTAVAATIAASTTATFATTTAEVATRTLLARTGDVDGQCATIHFLAVELFDRLLRLFGRPHFHEGKTARLAREIILDAATGC